MVHTLILYFIFKSSCNSITYTKAATGHSRYSGK